MKNPKLNSDFEFFYSKTLNSPDWNNSYTKLSFESLDNQFPQILKNLKIKIMWLDAEISKLDFWVLDRENSAEYEDTLKNDIKFLKELRAKMYKEYKRVNDSLSMDEWFEYSENINVINWTLFIDQLD